MAQSVNRRQAKKRNNGPEGGKRKVVYKRGSIDYAFLFLIMLLLSIGLVMLLSSSAPAGASKFDNSYHFFFKQIVFVFIGLIGMVFFSKLDYRIYRKFAVPIFGVCAFLLVLVAIPGIGVKLNGSRRWLPMPGFQLQPSEFMKFAMAVLVAALVSTGKYDLKKLKSLAPFGIVLGITAVLMLLEPHLSGTIVIVGIGVCVLIVAGMPTKPLFLCGIPLGGLTVVLIYFLSPNRFSRLMRFLSPFEDIQRTGYQIAQALYAMGSGGIFGRGIGQSIQKYSYLPEPYNDFIFSIACEELGLVGAAIIILLFILLIIRGLFIAVNSPDHFGTLLATGITAQVAIQTTLNIAVASSSVPNTGVSLPFFSYGGTAIMMLLFEMGVLLNISRYSKNTGISVSKMVSNFYEKKKK